MRMHLSSNGKTTKCGKLIKAWIWWVDTRIVKYWLNGLTYCKNCEKKIEQSRIAYKKRKKAK